MAQRKTKLILWLPPVSRLGAPAQALLRRATPQGVVQIDYLAALAAHFSPRPAAGWPVGALLRQYLQQDAGTDAWLAADPAWIQPDLNGAHLMTVSQLQLQPAEAEALVADLQPMFAEEGLQLVASAPAHWQLRLPAGLDVPALVPPEQALGEDVLAHLPTGTHGRYWRWLFNEAQTVLHSHPVNAARLSRGLPPVNSLWLWGAGHLPAQLTSSLQGVISDDLLPCALAQQAGIAQRPGQPDSLQELSGCWLLDLEPAELAAWWPSLERLSRQCVLTIRCADGWQGQHLPWHRWRIWRRRETT